MDLDRVILQKDFAALVGVGESAVSEWVADGILTRGATAREWLLAYCGRLREQAAGRASNGPLDLSQERAALARAQREGQEMRNAIARGEYAPIGLLADVLGAASAAIVDRLEQLPGQLRKVAPDMSAGVRDAIVRTIASARNEWIRATEELVLRRLDEITEITDVDEFTNPPDVQTGHDASSGAPIDGRNG